MGGSSTQRPPATNGFDPLRTFAACGPNARSGAFSGHLISRQGLCTPAARTWSAEASLGSGVKFPVVPRTWPPATYGTFPLGQALLDRCVMRALLLCIAYRRTLIGTKNDYCPSAGSNKELRKPYRRPPTGWLRQLAAGFKHQIPRCGARNR